MTNKIILDAWNVCWKIPYIAELIPDNLEMARQKFETMLKSAFHGKKIQYKIVYDGQPGIYNKTTNRQKNISFSRKPESADSLILKFLKKQKDAHSWTLVTSDRSLSFHARGFGARVMSSENFIKRLDYSKKVHSKMQSDNEPHLSQSEIDYWLKLFNDE